MKISKQEQRFENQSAKLRELFRGQRFEERKTIERLSNESKGVVNDNGYVICH